jgi:acetyl esterase/lipase
MRALGAWAALLLATAVAAGEASPPVLPLWPANGGGPAVGEKISERGTAERPDRSISNVEVPTLTVVLPAAGLATGAGVLICPGGGYASLAFDKEGLDVARWLAEHGIAGLALKYRLPRGAPGEGEPVPLQDVRRAMVLARERAGGWGIDPRRIGVMGFSAGGHLASTLITHATPQDRPDFAVLVYPVVTFLGPAAHGGSRDRLLGKGADQAALERYSNERQVSERTPPTFLVHAADDGVAIANSELFAAALQRAGVAHELVRLSSGGHGFGLGIRGGEPATWPGRLLAWMRARGLLTAP